MGFGGKGLGFYKGVRGLGFRPNGSEAMDGLQVAVGPKNRGSVLNENRVYKTWFLTKIKFWKLGFKQKSIFKISFYGN